MSKAMKQGRNKVPNPSKQRLHRREIVVKIASVLVVLAMLMSIVFSLTGCQSDSGLNAEEKELLKDEVASLTLAGKGQLRNDLHLALQALPRHLNPARATDSSEHAVLGQLFEGLVEADGDAYKLNQAESIETEDNQTFVVKLRPDLYWSDGSQIVAADFQRTLLKNLEPNTGTESYRGLILAKAAEFQLGKAKSFEVGIEADGLTLTFHLVNPLPDFPRWLSQGFYFAQKQGAAGEVLFSGGFQLPQSSLAMLGQAHSVAAESSDKGRENFILEANPYHFEAGQQMLQKIVFHLYPDAVAAYEAFRNQQLDMIGDPFYPIPYERRAAASTNPQLLRFEQSRFGYVQIDPYLAAPFAGRYLAVSEQTMRYCTRNHLIFSSARKRQALYDLLEASALSQGVLHDQSTPWPPRKNPDWETKEKAKKVLLNDFGERELELLKEQASIGFSPDNTTDYRILVALAKDWLAAMKIKLKINRLQRNEDLQFFDFAYQTDFAPAFDADGRSLILLWQLKGWQDIYVKPQLLDLLSTGDTGGVNPFLANLPANQMSCVPAVALSQIAAQKSNDFGQARPSKESQQAGPQTEAVANAKPATNADTPANFGEVKKIVLASDDPHVTQMSDQDLATLKDLAPAPIESLPKSFGILPVHKLQASLLLAPHLVGVKINADGSLYCKNLIWNG